ncbi:MAG: hypothetical protein PVI23_03090 [Maricaulaceae bacterium]|jgi:hypothetical protein
MRTRLVVRFGLVLAALASLAASASAVLPPEVYAQGRVDAVHHVQVRIDRRSGLSWFTDHGACAIEGEVVRVFRGDLSVGDEIGFDIDCAKPRANIPAGPVLWTAWRAIEDAAYIEVYLDAEGEIEMWQSMLLSAPSDEPACPVEGEGSC